MSLQRETQREWWEKEEKKAYCVWETFCGRKWRMILFSYKNVDSLQQCKYKIHTNANRVWPSYYDVIGTSYSPPVTYMPLQMLYIFLHSLLSNLSYRSYFFFFSPVKDKETSTSSELIKLLALVFNFQQTKSNISIPRVVSYSSTNYREYTNFIWRKSINLNPNKYSLFIYKLYCLFFLVNCLLSHWHVSVLNVQVTFIRLGNSLYSTSINHIVLSMKLQKIMGPSNKGITPLVWSTSSTEM